MKRKRQNRADAPSKTSNLASQPVASDVTPERPRRSPARIIFGLAMTAVLVLLNSKSAEQYVVCSSSQNIYTVDPTSPRVECMSVKGSRIGRVGSYLDVMASYNYLSPFSVILPAWVNQNVRIGPSVKVVQLDADSAVVPGLADAHAHIIENGYMNQLPLMGSQSIQEVIDRVNSYLVSHPDVANDTTRWIEGMGWDQTKWPGERFPTAADLESDPKLKDRLISLARVDGHARWVSPAVLRLMPTLPEKVDGGLIVRDKQGRPTGIFVDNAMSLIPVPAWSESQVADFFEATIKEALSFGLTSIHDADTRLDHIEFFKKMAEAGKLPNRLYLMGSAASGEYWGDQLPQLINYGKDGRLTLRSVKLYADGALGSWGAALLEPYSDDPKTKGLMLTSPESLEKLVRQFWKDGWQTGVHCIGDKANHVMLDIYENIIKEGANISEWRPRIEHAQIFAPTDLERIGKLGVIASVQPTHGTSDMWYAETRLGPERIKGAYAYQSLLRASRKGVLPLGSDFPIEGVNPLLGFYAVVSKLSVDGTSPHGPGGWFPEQRLTRDQALKGMTYDAAYAAFAEDDLGSLTSAKKADFVVFDKDIMTVPQSEILETRVRATVVDGKVVYGVLGA
ncbi:hypothetical protein M413DRAFT_444990 [Hebeloma cylindrosporum]|uniref:Amidohydrolase 3 domain-containing protein n=1 Tax=Hebeloma cylindrosporum TaxID=76867 RepID=A0A0C2YL46_HEBCY|nr:hypothetical protein M413DRAFT_444990 [Hebeloma cylindrosporum h7]